MAVDRDRLSEALTRDHIALCESSYPATHPASMLRLTAEAAATFVMAWEVGDAELYARAKAQLADAVDLYRRYFPDR